MSEKIDVSKIGNGYTWEAMMQTLLTFEDPSLKIYSRLGKDSAIDALSGNGLIVYQAKHHKVPALSKSISDAKAELAKIADYRRVKNYWKTVETWVLFTNLDINIEDENKWNTEIVPLFKAQGLKAVLYNWGLIQSLLIKHPAVIGPFFRDEARIFTTLSEELLRQESESWYSPALRMECVGRETAFATFTSFLQSNTKIWPVSGAGGMGKTRFLLECAKRLGPEWTPFWIIPRQIFHTSLYMAIVPERPTVLFIDELSNQDGLMLLLNELYAGRMKTWKIIFTERVSDSPLIQTLAKGKFSNQSFPLYKLTRLNDLQSEELLKRLLIDLNMTFTESIDNLAYRLTKISAGIPLWAGLCVKLIKETGSIENLPETANKLLKEYLEWFLQSLDIEDIEKNSGRLLLRWFSLFGITEIDDPKMLSFLSKKTALTKSKVLKVGELLVFKGLAFRIGANKKFIKIAPDSIRDEILKEALLDIDNPTTFATEVTSIILKEDVPQKERIIENLAYIEYLQDTSTETRIELISPIVDSILNRTLQGSTEEQLSAIEIINRFSFSRPKDALNILYSCWKTDRGQVPQEESLWGNYSINHISVRNNVPWALFQISQFADAEEDQKNIYNFYMEIISTEQNSGTTFSCNSESTQKLFIRTFFGEYWSGKFNKLAKLEADKLLGRIRELQPLSTTEMIVFHHLIEGLTTAEKMITGPSLGNRITFSRIHIFPGKRGWNQIVAYKNQLQDLLLKGDICETLRLEIAKLYAGILPSVNRTVLPERENSGSDAVNTFFQQEFIWMKNFLIRNTPNISIEIRDVLRQSWQWHLEFSINPVLKNAASDCESVYYTTEEHREIDKFLSFHYLNSEDYENEIIKGYLKWIAGKTTLEIADFLKTVSDFDQKRNHVHKIAGLGAKLGAETHDINLFNELCALLLPTLKGTYEWMFVTDFVQSFIRVRRIDSSTEVKNLLSSCLKFTSDVEYFIVNYYSNPWFRLGPFTDDDKDVILSNVDGFKNHINKMRLLAIATYCAWESITIYIDEMWDKFSEDEQREYLSELLEDSIQLNNLTKYNGFIWKDDKLNWLISKIISLRNLDWLERHRHHFDHYLPLKGYKSCEWLCETLKARQKIIQSITAVPHYFRLSYFAKIDLSNADDLKAIDSLIEMVAVNQHISIYIATYLKDLDRQSLVLGTLVANKIKTSKEHERAFRLAKIAGEFKRTEKAWQEISLAACEYIKDKDENDRLRMYQAIDWNGVEGYTRNIGSVAKELYAERDEIKEGLRLEKQPVRIEYWQKELEWAESSLKRGEEEASEELGE